MNCLSAQRRWRTSFGFGLWIACVALLGTGCKDATQRTASSGAYSNAVERPSAPATRLRSQSPDETWQQAPFYCLQTELSPAVLYHSTGKYLGLFTSLTNDGLGAPSHVAFSTMSGPRPYTNGAVLPREMEECWLLVWFAGANGWTNWDSPWAVFLQHRPRSVQLDSAGLHLEFPEAAGDVVVMPLYGYYKPSLKGREFLKPRGLPEKKVETWRWPEVLTRDVLARVRYWASAMREFPVYCQDSFSVDRSSDSVTIRQRFIWRAIHDDWRTRHLKLAPISPPLALASQDRQFPATFSAKVMDLDFFTPYGPYMAIEAVDEYDVTFKVLQYVNSTELPELPPTNAPPVARAALEHLRQTARDKFPRADTYSYDHGGMENFCWAAMGDLWYAKALPYYDPVTRSNALSSLRKYFHEDVLVTNRFKVREYPRGSGQQYLLLEGPGIGSWGVLGDAGKFSANLLETLWAYAHYTGDWGLIRERWGLIKALFTTPAETRWVGFSRDGIAELGDEAAPCLAMARLAWQAGDLDAYNYACYMFARELVHHDIKQRGAIYFRKHQPWHSMEAMDEEVYLTNLWGDVAGWQIDGPGYPDAPGERQYGNRWVRFKNEDVSRFYRDFLALDVRGELALLQQRWEPHRRGHNDSHILPSLVQLRSLLLNDPPEALGALATPNQFTGPPSGIIASCLAMLRTSHPTRLERLIPGGQASSWAVGLERDVPGPNPHLVQALETKRGDLLCWPRPSWWQSWRTPAGARWHFGEVRPVRAGEPAGMRRIPINWNTQVLAFSVSESQPSGKQTP